MNSLRFRIVKIVEGSIKDSQDFPFAVSISHDSLIWWIINRFKTFDQAKAYVTDQTAYMMDSRAAKIESIIWEGKI